MYQEDQVSPEEEQVPAEESVEEAPEEQAPAEESMDEAPTEEAASAGAAAPPDDEAPEEGGSRTWLWIALAAIGVLIVILGYFLLRPTEEPTQKLGLSLSTLNNPFFVTLKEGAEEAADKANVELIVVDSQDDPAREATNIEDLIQQGVDAILVNPTDADAVVPSIQKANEANIPVFTIDRGANGGVVISHIASDNVAGGALAGKFLCEAMGAEGKAVELEGIAGTSAARDRGNGFNTYMSSECPGVEIVARQTANFNRAEGLTVYENILQAEPEITGTFAHNDEMILGAIEAAEAAGRAAEIIFVGFDAVDDAVAAVDAGKLAATIAQQPAEMGRLGVETAVNYLNEEVVEQYIPVDLSLVAGDMAPPEPEPTEVTLGLSLSTLNNPFFVTLRDGAQAAADAAGAKLVVVDSQDDPAREATNVEDLIQQGVSVILINPTDSDAVVPSIQKANEAGIPVFTIDRGANGGTFISHIASDNVAGGMVAGKFLCDALGGQGKAVELEGIAGTSAARDRGLGFNDYMSKECSGVEIVARQTANFNRAEGLTVFENILQAQPEINGTFAHNDEMILGAIEAAEAAGREGIVFVGFDAVNDALAAVDAGRLAATIAQQPSEMGRLGVESALVYLAGQPVDNYIPVDLSLVSGELPEQPPVEPEPTEEPPAEAFTLGLSLSTLNNPFFVTLRDGAQAQADAMGVELIVVDAQDDSASEATNIEDLIQRGVSALLINPTDAAAIVPSVQKANEVGIPVFTVDRGADGGVVISHIASDNVAGGAAAAEFLCEALEGTGKVVELEGIAGTSAARDRGQGFNDYMSQECSGVEIIARQTANFNRAEGLTVYENILQAQPEIDGTFAHNDEMILGAIEAAEAAGRADAIIFVGFDAVDDAVQAVRDGKLAATIAQQPALMGQLGVEIALRFLGGDQVGDYIPVDLSLVTPENLP
jgi:ribose transport system substrate-binding protein